MAIITVLSPNQWDPWESKTIFVYEMEKINPVNQQKQNKKSMESQKNFADEHENCLRLYTELEDEQIIMEISNLSVHTLKSIISQFGMISHNIQDSKWTEFDSHALR